MCSPGSKVDEGRGAGMLACPAWWEMETQGIDCSRSVRLQEGLPVGEAPLPAPDTAPKTVFPESMGFSLVFPGPLFPNFSQSASFAFFLSSFSSSSSLPALPATHLPSSLPAGVQQQLAASGASDPVRGLRQGS